MIDIEIIDDSLYMDDSLCIKSNFEMIASVSANHDKTTSFLRRQNFDKRSKFYFFGSDGVTPNVSFPMSPTFSSIKISCVGSFDTRR